MPRPRERVCLQDGLKLDLNRLARQGFVRRGANIGGRGIKWTQLIADLDPDEWDFPPKPKWMRWATYKRYADEHDRYDDVLDSGLLALAAKFYGR